MCHQQDWSLPPLSEGNAPPDHRRRKGRPTVSLLRQGKADVLTIYVGEADQWHGEPVSVALVQLIRAQGCAGATVMRAVAGYGAGRHLHQQGGWHLVSDAPVVIQVVDQPDRLQRLLPQIQQMVPGGLITLHETTVLKYTHARRHGLPTKLPVRQVMETSLTAITPQTPATKVVEILLEASFRVLPVVDAQHHLLGIIGTRDLIHAGVLPVRRGVVRAARLLGEETTEAMEAELASESLKPLHASDLMNRQVQKIAPEHSVREAARIMLETGLRSLPVVEADGKLVGMLTRMHLLQVIVTSPLMSPQASTPSQPLRKTGGLDQAAIQQQPVGAYQRLDVATVGEETPLADVIDALISSSVKRVFVVDHEGRVQGVISDVDLLVNLQEHARPGWLKALASLAHGTRVRIPTSTLRSPGGSARAARDLMNPQVVSVEASATVEEAIELMVQTGRKVLPVLDAEGHVQGMVGRTDLLQLLLEG